VRECLCQLLDTGHLLKLTAVYNTVAPPANYPNQHRQAMFFNRLHSHSGQQGYALTQQTCHTFKEGPPLNTLCAVCWGFFKHARSKKQKEKEMKKLWTGEEIDAR